MAEPEKEHRVSPASATRPFDHGTPSSQSTPGNVPHRGSPTHSDSLTCRPPESEEVAQTVQTCVQVCPPFSRVTTRGSLSSRLTPALRSLEHRGSGSPPPRGGSERMPAQEHWEGVRGGHRGLRAQRARGSVSEDVRGGLRARSWDSRRNQG